MWKIAPYLTRSYQSNSAFLCLFRGISRKDKWGKTYTKCKYIFNRTQFFAIWCKFKSCKIFFNYILLAFLHILKTHVQIKFSAQVDFYTPLQNVFYWSQNTKYHFKKNNKIIFISLRNTFPVARFRFTVLKRHWNHCLETVFADFTRVTV